MKDQHVENLEDWLILGPTQPLGSGALYNVAPFGDFTLVTDSRGRWVCIASMSPAGTGDPNAERDLYIYRSDDNGDSWSPESLLHPDFATDNRSDHQPKLVTDRKGNWVVVWQTQGEDTEPGRYYGTRMTYVSRSADNAQTWSSPGPLNPRYDRAKAENDEEELPLLDTDRDGTWLCAMLVLNHGQTSPGSNVFENSQVNILRSRDAGKSWSEPQVVYESPVRNRVSLYNLALAGGASGCFTLGWTQTTPSSEEKFVGSMASTFTGDGGDTWSEISVMDPSHGMDLRISAGNGESRVAVWKSGKWSDNGQWVTDGIVSARSRDSGRTWTPSTTIHKSGTNAVSLSEGNLSTDGDQHWLGVWQGFHDTDRDMDVYGSVSLDDGGRWSSIAALNPNADSDEPWEYEMAPTLATDGNGRWIVVWQSGDATGFRLIYRVCDVLNQE